MTVQYLNQTDIRLFRCKELSGVNDTAEVTLVALCLSAQASHVITHPARAGEKLIGSQQPTMVTNAGNRLCFSSNVIRYHNKAIHFTMMIYLCWAEQNKPTHFVLRKTNIKQSFFCSEHNKNYPRHFNVAFNFVGY